MQKQFTYSLLSAAVVLGLSACGGSDTNYEPTLQGAVVAGATQFQPQTGSIAASDPNGDPITFSASYDESAGDFSIDADGNYSFTPYTDEDTMVQVTASDGELSTTVELEFTGVQGDPLAYQQWHLRNTGQAAYSQSDAYINFLLELGYTQEDIDFFLTSYALDPTVGVRVAGEDMNVVEAYAQGAFGQGMMVAVVDSGLELQHEDLVDRIAPGKSLNFIPGATNLGDPTSVSLFGDHGTSVGGLIAATAGNGLGGRGVAPQAQLFGLNFLGGAGTQTTRNLLLSHGIPGSGVSTSDPIIAYNRSYGVSYPGFFYTSATEEAGERYVQTALRNGLGALNVKSAGNSFGSSGGLGDLCSVMGAVEYDLTCLNGNMDTSNANFYTVTVAAVNADGGHVSYSTAGSNVFVAAPSGEYGVDAPAMVTTDQATCLRGYSGFPSADDLDAQTIPGYSAAIYPFNTPGHPENPSCSYTSTFNGTSSAAPNTAGVVALIGSANPDLSAREIRHILANTATMVDPNDAPSILPVGEGEFVADPGWIENGAGYMFNLKYGFGRVDAGAAVTMAREWQAGSLPAFIETEWMDVVPAAPVVVPDNDATGGAVEIEVADDITIEGIQFRLTVTNDDFDSGNWSSAGNDLAIEVTSPAGTTTQLLSGRQAINFGVDELSQGLTDFILDDSVFLANAFYGESTAGTWTIRVVDTNDTGYLVNGAIPFANNSVPSQIEKVGVRVFGH